MTPEEFSITATCVPSNSGYLYTKQIAWACSDVSNRTYSTSYDSFLNNMPRFNRYKRIRIRDIWIDEHPGSLLSEPDLDHNTRILPGDADPDVDEDFPIQLPQEPPPAPFPVSRVCTPNYAVLIPNLLRGVNGTQWIQPTLTFGMNNPFNRFTNGRNNIQGWNFIGYDNNSTLGNVGVSNHYVYRPMIYVLPTPSNVAGMNFHYNLTASLSALNYVTPLTPKIEIGGITVRFFNEFNVHLGDAIHKPSGDFPRVGNIGPYDTCVNGSNVKLTFNKELKNVKKLHIHYHSRHSGLCEIELFGLPLPTPPPVFAPPTIFETLINPPPARSVTNVTLEFLTQALATRFGEAWPSFGNNGQGSLTNLIDSNTLTLLSASNKLKNFLCTLPTPRTITDFEVYWVRQPNAGSGVIQGVCGFNAKFFDENDELVFDTVGISSNFVSSNPLGQYRTRLLAGTQPITIPNIKYIIFNAADDFCQNWHSLYF